MATFAHIINNTVLNVLIADSKENAEIATKGTCLEYTEENPAKIGDTYDEATGKFVSPVGTTPEDTVVPSA
jgi:hypothetical protein